MSAELEPVGLGLMCKPPRPGVTKTRLAATAGAAAAARLSRAFLQDCAAAAAAAAVGARLDLAAFYRPADAEAEIAAVLGPDWPPFFADAGDLGATMLDVLRERLRRCPAGAIVMGADVPLVDAAAVAAAARLLREGDRRRAVIGPTADGGYWLIGVRDADAAEPLFAPMAWSTPDVFAETRRRVEVAGLDLVVLPIQRDIDDAGDLDWLKQRLERAPGGCPATRAALRTLAAGAEHG